MSYCTRDGPGNLKTHLKTKGCQALQMGAPAASVMAAVAAAPSVARRKVSRRTRVPSECNVIKTQGDCRDPCIWKTGKGGSQFCSKKGLSGAKRSAAADALLMIGR